MIPARLQSTRLPRKMLLEVDGPYSPLIRWVAERIQRHTRYRVIVTTDSEEIAKRFPPNCGHAQVVLNDQPCRNGTERCYNAAQKLGLPEDAVIVNWQGDEVRFDVKNVEQLVHMHSLIPDEIVTAAIRYGDIKDDDVYAIRDRYRRALYFSRAVVPPNGPRFKHVGIYVYSVKTLAKYCDMLPGELEEWERLEQLRAVENGIPVYVQEFNDISHSINNQEDFDEHVRFVRSGK